MTLAIIDFETFSEIDLETRGSDRYANSSSTRVTRMAWTLDNGNPIELWRPGEPFPEGLRKALDEGTPVFAWHAAFDAAIWHHVAVPRYGFPDIPDSQFFDAALFARALTLPGSLAFASGAPWFKHEKSKEGHDTMMAYCRPNADGSVPEETPEAAAEIDAYCKQDLEATREVLFWCGDRTPEWEFAVIDVTKAMNARGLAVDRDLLSTLLELRAISKQRVDEAFHKLVDFNLTQLAVLKKWLREQIPELYAERGKLGAAEISELLVKDLPEHVAQVLRLRSWGSRTSLAKLDRLSTELFRGRCRNALVHFGATTGRWSSVGIQLQNVPKETVDQSHVPLLKSRDIDAIEAELGPLPEVLPMCLRLLFVPGKDNVFLGGDYSAIEARVAAWVSGQDWLVQAFAEGKDVYIAAAARMLRIDEAQLTKTSPERQLGKIAALLCQFGGGSGPVRESARKYGMDMPVETAEEHVKSWRETNSKIEASWHGFEAAAKEAVFTGKRVRIPERYCAPEVAFEMDPTRNILFCHLPSGRRLAYLEPRFRCKYEGDDRPDFMITLFPHGPSVATKIWGSKFYHHVVQALSRDLIAIALVNLEADGLYPVLTIHDEVLVEVHKDTSSEDELKRRMVDAMVTKRPDWASSLHISVEPWVGQRWQPTKPEKPKTPAQSEQSEQSEQAGQLTPALA